MLKNLPANSGDLRDPAWCFPIISHQIGKPERLWSIFTKISTSHPSKLDLSPWELMCTFLLTGGRSGNMASCEPCNMSTGFKGYVWFHHLSFFFFFVCHRNANIQGKPCSFPWMPAGRKRPGAGPTSGLEQQAKVARQSLHCGQQKLTTV